MSSETIRLMCPNLICRRVLSVPRTARGKTVRCRHCQTSVRVPPEGYRPAPKAAAGESAGS